MIVNQAKRREVERLVNDFITDNQGVTVGAISRQITQLALNVMEVAMTETPPTGVLREDQEDDSVGCVFVVGVQHGEY